MYCAKCGEKLNPNNNFCTHCGSRVYPNESNKKEHKSTNSKAHLESSQQKLYSKNLGPHKSKNEHRSIKPVADKLKDTCLICGQQRKVQQIEFYQNTGMLLTRYQRTYKGDLCRDCTKQLFKKVQVHNIFFGWWGVISFVATAVFLLGNSVSFVNYLYKTR